jgi:hypothetical protein
VAHGRTWTWRCGCRAIGIAALGLALAPFIVPYAQNRAELGMERDRAQNDASSPTSSRTSRGETCLLDVALRTSPRPIFMGSWCSRWPAWRWPPGSPPQRSASRGLPTTRRVLSAESRTCRRAGRPGRPNSLPRCRGPSPAATATLLLSAVS